MITAEHQKLFFEGVKYLLATFVGALIGRKFERAPNLISYFGHVSAFSAKSNDGTPFTIHTHEVVLRNAGWKAATNVRLSHHTLPDQFNISPSIPFSVETLEGGGRDIVIPVLVPKQQITIAYLYSPPLTYAQVNAGIRSDEGFANPVQMELTKKPARITIWIVVALAAVGVGTALYGLLRLLEILGV